jgi:hypothetical protein
MKNQNIHYRRTIPALLIAFVLSCLSLSSAARADDDDRSIVGFWKVHFFHGTQELFQTFIQWHSDGLEIEFAPFFPGAVCYGTFNQAADGTIHLFHVAFTFDANGVVNGHFEMRQTNIVGPEGNHYRGTFDQKFYDLNGNLTGENMGTVRATRISVH